MSETRGLERVFEARAGPPVMRRGFWSQIDESAEKFVEGRKENERGESASVYNVA